MNIAKDGSVRARSRQSLLGLAVAGAMFAGVPVANASPSTRPAPLQAADSRSDLPGLRVDMRDSDQESEAVTSTNRVVVRWSANPTAEKAGASSRLAVLSRASGREAAFVRISGSGAAIYDLGAPLGRDAGRIVQAIGQVPDVMAVEPDLWLTADTLPNDPHSASLWGLLGAADGSPYGIDAGGAWGRTTGEGVVVAVIDTGLVAHVDLGGQAVAGYDMIAEVATANDGNGRDGDASDPGDWCGPNPSSWHGTHVAGTIAALANNGIGVFGGAPGVRIQPVRVLGVCGGYDSDVADGIRWAAGGSVPGVASNPTPARVLNLSLGGSSPTCPAELSSAISNARSRGAVVVVSAGNDATNASLATPANCPGVITVAATGQTGRRASFSNYGAVVEMAGPGVSILSTIDSGTTVPAGSTYDDYEGTSMAAPHVALTAALVAAAAPTLTPAEIEAVLAATSTPFASDASGTGCAALGCGVGIVNAGSAVASLPSQSVPGAPTAVRATPADASALVAWTAPASGSSPITSYTVTSAPGGKTCTADTLNCIVTGLTNGTPYTFRVTATNTVGTGPPSLASTAVIPMALHEPGAVYVPLTPVRLLDSRFGNGLNGTFKTGIVRTFIVADRGGVPAHALAVTGNLTVTGQTSAGYVSVGPTMIPNPTTSTLNAPRADTRANGLTVKLSSSGRLAAVWTGSPGSTTHLIFDVTGYFTESGSGAVYVPLTPVRLLDSRFGNGLNGTFKTGIVRTFIVADRGGVPAHALAVTGNLTVTGQTSAGYVSVGPTMIPNPTTSTLNAPRADTRANGLTVKLSSSGRLAAVWTGSPGSTTHLIFDVTGYFTESGSGAVYVPLTPVRLLDSRFGNGLNGTFKTGIVRTFIVADRGGVPAHALAVTGNLTVTGQTSAGYVSVGPTMIPNPTTSTLNAPRADTRANGLTVKLSSSGRLAAVWTGSPGSTTHLIFDVTGYFR